MKFIAYGKILKPHGLKGEIKVLPYSIDPENFKQVQYIYTKSDSNNEPQRHKVSAKRFQKHFIIAKLQNINNIEDAEALRNKEIHVDRNELPSNQEDEYYWFELIGLNVYNENECLIGQVDSLIDNTAQPILVIKNNSEEYMVPFIDRFVKEVNLDNSKIVVKSIADLI